MKIAFGEIRSLLQSQRIFLGGQRLVCDHPFYRDEQPIEVPENLCTEPYTTYWGAVASGWLRWGFQLHPYVVAGVYSGWALHLNR